MKRAIFSLALIVLGMSLQAQTPQFTIAPQVKSQGMKKSEFTKILAAADDGTYAIVRDTKTGLMKGIQPQEVQIVKYNALMAEEWNYTIPNSDGWDILQTTVADNKAYLLCQYGEKNHEEMFVVTCDLNAQKTIGDPRPVYNISSERKDEVYSWTSCSPNKAYVAVVYAILKTGKNELEMHEVLMDDEMETVWTKEYEIGAMNSIFATNDGEIVTLGLDHSEDRPTRTSVVVGYLSDEDEMAYVDRQQFGISDLEILNCVNRKVVMLGVRKADSSPKNKEHMDGYFGMVMDMSTGNAVYNMSDLTLKEVNVLSNQKESTKQKSNTCDALCVRQKAVTDFGGCGVLERVWSVTVCSNQGGCNTTFYTMGEIVVGVDTTGEIRYSSPIRHFGTQSNFNYGMRMGFITQGNDSYLMVCEDKKSPATYQTADKVRVFLANRTAPMLTLYKIAANGDVTKFDRTAGPKLSFLESNLIEVAEGEYRFVMSNASKGGINTLKLK